MTGQVRSFKPGLMDVLLVHLRIGGKQVFHAGTATNECGELVASGGRVLGVTALGADVAEAQRKAYEVLPTVTNASVRSYRAMAQKKNLWLFGLMLAPA